MRAISAGCALVLAIGFAALASCSGQSRSEAQYAAIVAGCKAGLDIERDAGEAGAVNETAEGCRAALRSWEHAK